MICWLIAYFDNVECIDDEWYSSHCIKPSSDYSFRIDPFITSTPFRSLRSVHVCGFFQTSNRLISEPIGRQCSRQSRRLRARLHAFIRIHLLVSIFVYPCKCGAHCSHMMRWFFARISFLFHLLWLFVLMMCACLFILFSAFTLFFHVSLSSSFFDRRKKKPSIVSGNAQCEYLYFTLLIHITL